MMISLLASYHELVGTFWMVCSVIVFLTCMFAVVRDVLCSDVICIHCVVRVVVWVPLSLFCAAYGPIALGLFLLFVFGEQDCGFGPVALWRKK